MKSEKVCKLAYSIYCSMVLPFSFGRDKSVAVPGCEHVRSVLEVLQLCLPKKTLRKTEQIINGTNYVGVSKNGGTQQPWGYPTKNDHFGVFWGYHHLRKPPQTSMLHLGGFPGEGKSGSGLCG